MEQEVWVDIFGYEGLYQVSNQGRIVSLRFRKEKILTQINSSGGYLSVNLYGNGLIKSFLIHRLIAIAFIKNPDNKLYVNHKNGIKIDNRIINLEWVTASENIIHAYNTGLNKSTEKNFFKVNHPRSQLGKKGRYNHLSKPVCQYTLDGDIIKKWHSAMDVQREIRIPQTNISSCCLGKVKTAGGFIWKYTN